MSQVDEEKLQETEVEGEEFTASSKLVPVTESIRYRKRAQGAEKKNEVMATELERVKSELSSVIEQLDGVRFERELMSKLSMAGARDLEATVLLAKARLRGDSQADVDCCIERLKKEKQYLFDGSDKPAATISRTAGVKERLSNNQSVVERAAKKAASTGDKRDLQEYLKLRRNFI